MELSEVELEGDNMVKRNKHVNGNTRGRVEEDCDTDSISSGESFHSTLESLEDTSVSIIHTSYSHSM